VPGCIHTDLLRHGLIPDPFWANNERDLQWIEERDWRYFCQFKASPECLAHERVDLVMEGLDTVASVRLNGKLILESDNMFIARRVEVTDLIRQGNNLIEVDFQSLMKTI
jgi:beta-mannosidase